MTALKQETIEKTSVFLSDPQVLFREGIHFILSGEDDFEVTGETTSNEDAYSQIIANPPNVAILSAQDVKVSGQEMTSRLKRNLPSLSVILILSAKESPGIFSALKAGASACVTKDTDPDFLLDIIRIVAQGSSPIIDEILTPEIAAMAVDEFKEAANLNQQVDNLLSVLTATESQLLNSIAAGNDREQIQVKLGLTEDGIRRQLRMITNKLISNERSRALVEAGQRSMTAPIFRSAAIQTKSRENYVTRAEFNEFKEQFMERLKAMLGELA